jgi:Ca-activated chloride channel family protein
MLRLILCLFALWPPTMALAEGRAIIVLDASGSMWDELDGRPKVDTARQALNAVLRALPPDAELGLMAYGHREKGNCDDIELIVPPAKGRAAAIGTAAEFLNFTGKTPLTAAVRQAAAALDSGTRQASVILITDGVDNCSGDPCALGATLAASGADFTAHVIGFGLTDAEAATVSCLATQTGGSYLQADDLQTLTLALQDTVLVPDTAPVPPQPAPAPAPQPSPEPSPTPAPAPEPAPEPTPQPEPPPVAQRPNFSPRILLSPNGPPVDPAAPLHLVLHPLPAADLSLTPIQIIHDSTAVPPGDYMMQATLGPVTLRQPVTISTTGDAQPTLVLNAAPVTFRPRIGPDAAVEATAEITIATATGPIGPLTGQFDTWLPAGQHRVSTRLDAVTATQDIHVIAGQPLVQDLFINAALVVPKVFFAPGQPVNSAPDLRIEIVAALPNVDGSRTLISRRIGGTPFFHLGAGDYVAIATLGLARSETPFSIALVQRTELPVILNAGVLSATAPGASLIRISPPPDIAGNAPAGREYANDTVQETLNAGSYQVSAQFGTATATAMVVITPGGRADVALSAP